MEPRERLESHHLFFPLAFERLFLRSRLTLAPLLAVLFQCANVFFYFPTLTFIATRARVVFAPRARNAFFLIRLFFEF